MVARNIHVNSDEESGHINHNVVSGNMIASGWLSYLWSYTLCNIIKCSSLEGEVGNWYLDDRLIPAPPNI